MNSDILVSVIIPTYNSSRTLYKCLRSVEDQTFKNYEVIIVDGFSRDETKNIALRFVNHNPSYRYIEIPYKFQAQKRNVGIKASRGKYIFFLDSDQYMKPKLLESALNYAEQENIEALRIPVFPLFKSTSLARA
jgi:glycosyltransferase involved in cell wall biosynthesis